MSSRRHCKGAGDASLDREGSCGHEAGVVTREVRHGAGEFLDCAKAPHRVVDESLRELLGRKPAEQLAKLRSLDWPKAQDIHAHTPAREVRAQVAGELD